MGEWISVNDRLPREDEKALCHGSRNSYFVSVDNENNRLIMRNGKWRIWSVNDCRWRTFTHWMPIPELPKEGEE